MNRKSNGRDKHIVIVESPAKANTIKKFLGDEYEVEACMGHVRDLPESRFGIDVENDFEPEYEIVEGKEDILENLEEKVSRSDRIYLAPDPDREGEAIAWHLTKVLNLDQENGNGNRVHRVSFNEITRQAVEEAFENPGDISDDLVNAQQARRFLDRIVGYRLSPLLWDKVARGLSAGRVQSVAVMLVVERDREIEAFDPEEYWEIDARLHEDPDADLDEMKEDEEAGFEAELFRVEGEKPDIGSEEEAGEIVEDLDDATFTVEDVERKKKMDNPGPPYHTSLLQQRASSKLRFSTKKTMVIAQQLYEGIDLGDEGAVGLITYMRTDSFRISGDAMKKCRSEIQNRFGDKYLPEDPRFFQSKEGAEEAHECIRPTSVSRDPWSIKEHLSSDQFKLYRLIWKRFVASQMTPAVYHNTRADIAAANTIFRARGRELVFPGYLKLMGTGGRKKSQILPELEEDQELGVIDIIPSQHFTKPPPHYTEASLVKTLEDKGIGRPSTYSPILSTIQDRGYVEKNGRSLESTDLGRLVNDKLKEHFDDLMDTEFTSRVEEQLDEIEESHVDWKDILQEFYERFTDDLENAKEDMSSEKGKKPEEEVTCSECGEEMVIRWNRDGKFLGCSAFPECKNTRSMEEPDALGESCPECGEDLVVKEGRSGEFIGCSTYPDCDYTRSLDYVKGPDGNWWRLQMDCNECDGKLVVRTSRNGKKFLGCSGFPDCRNTTSFPNKKKKKRWIEKDYLVEPEEVSEDES